MRIASYIFFLLLVIPISVQAQSISHLPSDILKDEPRIWTSPLHSHRSDSKWLLPFAAGTAALLITDHSISEDVHETPSLLSPSHRVSNLGGGPALAIASGSLFSLGKLAHNEHAATTGLLAGEAVIHSTIVVQVLKLAFNRERPDKAMGSGAFWGGGQSFPSGHSTATWSLATVLAHEYPNKRMVRIGAYGVATAVSLSRVDGLNHFPSDVAVGAVVGSLIGQYVLHHHEHR